MSVFSECVSATQEVSLYLESGQALKAQLDIASVELPALPETKIPDEEIYNHLATNDHRSVGSLIS
jgi:hypothetical protein